MIEIKLFDRIIKNPNKVLQNRKCICFPRVVHIAICNKKDGEIDRITGN